MVFGRYCEDGLNIVYLCIPDTLNWSVVLKKSKCKMLFPKCSQWSPCKNYSRLVCCFKLLRYSIFFKTTFLMSSYSPTQLHSPKTAKCLTAIILHGTLALVLNQLHFSWPCVSPGNLALLHQLSPMEKLSVSMRLRSRRVREKMQKRLRRTWLTFSEKMESHTVGRDIGVRLRKQKLGFPIFTQSQIAWPFSF